MSPTHVVTVINAPSQPALRADAAGSVRVALQMAGASTHAWSWLDEGVAFDVPFAVEPGAGDVATAQSHARQALHNVRADVVVLPLAGRRKKLLVADMDSTIIGQECLDELAARAGVGAEVAALTERAMRGEVDFAEALQQRVALLKDQPVALLDRTYAESVRLNPGARTLARTMHAHGAHAALVSGGFKFFTSRVAAAAGFDSFGGNEFEIEGGNLTGGIAGDILGADAKLARLKELTAELDLDPKDTLALGDGANDIPMLQAGGLGVAYHAKPKVRAAVAARIDHGDLTAVLYLQGYRAAEFVRD
ncbi:MAG: phosphoserine phosphatase SerB [Alphaproteobacteria bacterium]|nr:phosphoserine phosphatase SerB [Alphaproteobacteria bacterium]